MIRLPTLKLPRLRLPSFRLEHVFWYGLIIVPAGLALILYFSRDVSKPIVWKYTGPDTIKMVEGTIAVLELYANPPTMTLISANETVWTFIIDRRKTFVFYEDPAPRKSSGSSKDTEGSMYVRVLSLLHLRRLERVRVYHHVEGDRRIAEAIELIRPRGAEPQAALIRRPPTLPRPPARSFVLTPMAAEPLRNSPTLQVVPTPRTVAPIGNPFAFVGRPMFVENQPEMIPLPQLPTLLPTPAVNGYAKQKLYSNDMGGAY